MKMRFTPHVFLALFFLLGKCLEGAPKESLLPAGIELNWGKERIEALSSTRAKMELNGIWQYIPALTDSPNELQASGWGYIEVPGSWQKGNGEGFVNIAGKSGLWLNLKKTEAYWYQRVFSLPKEWRNKQVILAIEGVGDSADVFLNGYPLKKINGLGGEVDLTSIVRGDSPNTLQILVTPDGSDSPKGLTGKVALLSRPKDSYIESVWVRPSMDTGSLGIDVDLVGVKPAVSFTFTLEVRDQKNNLLQRNSKVMTTNAGDSQLMSLSFPWQHPDRMWSFQQGNLLKLSLTVRGVGFLDTIQQDFGFCEFFFGENHWELNKVPLALRGVSIDLQGNVGVKWFRDAGFSIGLIEKFDVESLVHESLLKQMIQEADSLGFPLLIEVPDNVGATWGQQVNFLWRMVRNHPSFVGLYSKQAVDGPEGVHVPIISMENIPLNTPTVHSDKIEEKMPNIVEFAASIMGAKSYDFIQNPDYLYQYLSAYFLQDIWSFSRIDLNKRSSEAWKILLDKPNSLLYKMLERVNAPVCLWIAGSVDNVISKAHHYYAGESVEKSCVVLNQTLSEKTYKGFYSISQGSNVVFKEVLDGKLAPNEMKCIPLKFQLPDITEKTSMMLSLTLNIEGDDHLDDFRMEVFPRLRLPEDSSVYVYDPEGSTQAYLQKLGFKTIPWNGKKQFNHVLVIGRNALSQGGHLPGSLGEFIKLGGRVVICGQAGKWFESHLGLSLSEGNQHRMWPVGTQKESLVFAHLDDLDFLFWNGHVGGVKKDDGSDSIAWMESSGFDFLPWVFRYGAEGSLAPQSFIKPVCGGWIPFLESGEGLNETSLLFKRYGKGCFMVSTLAFEDRTDEDPVADQLFVNMIEYVGGYSFSGLSKKIYYIGGAGGSNLLNELRVVYDSLARLPAMPGTLVVDDSFSSSAAAIRRFMSSGGRIIFLPSQKKEVALGVKTELDSVVGAFCVPSWDEMAGVSRADISVTKAVEALPLVCSKNGKVSHELLYRINEGAGHASFLQVNHQASSVVNFDTIELDRDSAKRILSIYLNNAGAKSTLDDKLFAWEEAMMPGEGADVPVVSNSGIGGQTLTPMSEVDDHFNSGGGQRLDMPQR